MTVLYERMTSISLKIVRSVVALIVSSPKARNRFKKTSTAVDSDATYFSSVEAISLAISLRLRLLRVASRTARALTTAWRRQSPFRALDDLVIVAIRSSRLCRSEFQRCLAIVARIQACRRMIFDSKGFILDSISSLEIVPDERFPSNSSISKLSESCSAIN